MPRSTARYTQRANQVMKSARHIASTWGHQHLEPIHLLIGMYQEQGSIANRVIIDLALEDVLNELQRNNATNAQTVSDINNSSQTEKLLNLALNQARKWGQHYVGTEHLLMACVQIDDTEIKQLKIDSRKVHEAILHIFALAPQAVTDEIRNDYARTIGKPYPQQAQ